MLKKNLATHNINSVVLGAKLLVIGGPAEFISSPAPTHRPCSFQIRLEDLISCL